MAKIALACDSAADIPKEAVAAHNIHVLPLTVIFGEEALKEGVDISVEAFYERVQAEETLPTTSQPPLGEFVALYEQLAEEGYEDVIFVTLAATISGTNQTAQTAATMVDGIRVHVFDSQIATYPEGFYVLEAAQMIEQGQDVPAILERLESIRTRGIEAYFMVDDLNHLHRGGRLTGAQAFIGSLLRMKPLLSFENSGIHPKEKIRTKKKAIQRLKEIFAEKYTKDKPIRMAALHAHSPEDAEAFKAWVNDVYPEVDIITTSIGPVIGTHVGTGTVAIVWYEK
ncbi:protein DegV [Pullulanibacillus camelliae]|uniref:Protein DegV n=2 Tax=Pullulanibacillus camelliae TaxID=1707096 RepID=A0A8J2YG10_9BACL|nr:protein DegV [Pullulanibacillus camelliae]